jgi:hypothetical protein
VTHPSKADLDRHLAQLQNRLPPTPARLVGWLRRPLSPLLRIPLAIALMMGGVFSILPVLGVWMLPLGLILVAQDVPFLRGPVIRLLAWAERKYIHWQRHWQKRWRRHLQRDSA